MLKKLLKKLTKLQIRIPIFVPGMGCGVLGMAMPKLSLNLGRYAAALLKDLEYRGYDSTGAAFLDDKKKITLLKDVGAPTRLVKTLGIEKQAGKIFCGQVRWASSGLVTKENAQPHLVNCKREIFGAHNGNITNTGELINFLSREGHDLTTDTDGEMLIHVVEHYFDIEMNKAGNPEDPHKANEAMRKAIIRSGEKIAGSYAAVIVNPKTETSWAIKSGSSLYFGVGKVDKTDFALASSDLTSVLRFTKMLVNLREGEFIEYDSDNYQVYALRDLRFKRLGLTDEVYSVGKTIPTRASYSRLRAEDVELSNKFKYFMEQEIYSQSESTGKLIKLFQGGSNSGRYMKESLEKADVESMFTQAMLEILGLPTLAEKQQRFDELCKADGTKHLLSYLEENYKAIFDVAIKENFEQKYFFSDDKNVFIELLGSEFDKSRLVIAKALDSISETVAVLAFEQKIQAALKLMENTIANNRNIYSIACGTSFHATKIAALFFNEIAQIELIPILPGDFRGEYSYSITNDDLVVGVSQSGETKDLIDIFNDIDNKNINVHKVVVVNNLNSTLGQEKSDVAIPILCGPEIAVPATKSFMNQITVFYYLALRAAEMKLERYKDELGAEEYSKQKAALDRRRKLMGDIPTLLKETVNKTDDVIDKMATKMYLEPSMHILATKITGVALEGALKIRETVLTHAEGKEASEFKHGPNTILGKNTVFGVKHVRSFLREFSKMIDTIDEEAKEINLGAQERKELLKALADYIFTHNMPFNLSREGTKLFKETVKDRDFFEPLYRNYPLVYVTGPNPRDVQLTISQINTHKIRGANSFVIAEENEALLKSASTNPKEGAYYSWAYVMLPKTGDTLMTCFSATIVLQLLALRMSIRKMSKLDLLGVKDHGVHPDVPKNATKSITVD